MAASNGVSRETSGPQSESEPASTQRSEKTTDSDDETPAHTNNDSSPGRDRLASGSWSKVSKSKYQRAGSATSKSSGGGGSGKTNGRQRQDSLKHAKEIAESNISLAQTAQKRGIGGQRPSHLKTVEAFLPHKTRVGSEFRVGNVGIGGKIYLTPKNKPASTQSGALQSPTRPRPTLRIAKAEEEGHLTLREGKENEAAIEDDDDDDNMSDSLVNGGKAVRTDFTGRESVWTKLSTHDAQGTPSDIFKYRPRSRRSMSESTVSHGPGRTSALAQTKAFKVVIDRPDSDPASRHQSTSNTFDGLDISIPNYQMGSPRFTDQGTPFLHGAAFAAPSSQVAAIPSPQFLENMPDGPSIQPVIKGPSPIRRQIPTHLRPPMSSPYDESVSSLSLDAGLIPTSLDPFTLKHHPAFTGHETISPAIYDILAAAPNDPSVVRYSPVTGEMVAATPARLIVQITAETFLDYELLSDFFLTVRSYLSIHDLLSLMLARFEWAVSRFDDNGRIIRVRSFAAIRHWILNYFAYDFVPDRRLRVQFSRKMNELFRIVRSRGEAGLPDLKLISDLKKCWNGRCVLYWSRAVDNSFEADLLPGGPGIEGEEDPNDGDNATIGSVTAASTDGVYTVPPSPHANYDLEIGGGGGGDGGDEEGSAHSRTASDLTTTSAPQSPTSETTTDAASSIAAHIAAAQQAQHAAQQAAQPPHRHSSGGYTGNDSYGSEQAQPAVAYPLQASAYRSVLRGHLLAPASPYVTTSTVQSTASPALSPTAADARPRPSQSGVSGSGSGMGKLIGTFKRALGGKMSSGVPYDAASGAAGGATSPSQQKYDAFRNVRSIGDATRGNSDASSAMTGAVDGARATMRIDLLAEMIAMEFQRAMQGHYRYGQRQELPRAGPQTYPPVVAQTKVPNFLSPPEANQVPSGMTSSSQSIVIVDDTGDSMESRMRGASGPAEHTPRGSMQGPARPDAGGLAPDAAPPRRLSAGNIAVTAHEVGSTTTSTAATPARLSYIDGGHQRQVSHGGLSLRRVASYQSTLNRLPVGTNDNSPAAGLVPDPSQQDGTMIPASAVPARSLRRVPGGNLRANEKIGDLEQMPRPKSTGSIATFASTRESEMLTFGDRITKTFKRDRTDRPLISPALTGSFGDPFKKNAEKDDASDKVSYTRAQSEDKAARRPSLDAWMARFAEIPDEEEGGIEATLLKLEGKYSKGAVAAARRASKAVAAERANGNLTAPTGKRKPSTSSADTLHPKQHSRSTMTSTDYAGSEDSYNSTPLLERDSTTPRAKSKGSSTRSNVGLRPKSNGKRTGTKSFLLDEHEDSTDEVSDGSRRPSDGGGGGGGVNRQRYTASPPTNGVPRPAYQNDPVPQPTRNFIERHIGNTGGPSSSIHPVIHMPLASGLHPRHMPFVLAHDSRVLCEQLTLIEKDSLREIDWRDLVEMRWQGQASTTTTTNWVSYLLSCDPQGIDLVTARFNIMVKWLLSEIVLTESAEERANVIVKMIHIAREARRICNYATLLQFTIALTSIDCSRMKKTWSMVPEADVQTIRDLEQLVSPRRNFANLRSEMEEAPAESGCIPVLALYIHDLTYNAQRPPVVEVDLGEASKRTPRYLINFERYRNTAVIVKALLRLIDASSRYNFVPVDDVLSHCMWIACLPDDVIASKSRASESVGKPDAPNARGNFR